MALNFARTGARRASAFICAAAAFAIAPAVAQDAQPACTDDIYRAFDFWLGEWDVALPNGDRAGVNSITAEENGCLVLERWRSASGGTGQSYNFYDPAAAQWRQLWVSKEFIVDYAGGLSDGGDMLLEGTITYRDGRTAPFRGVWTPLKDGGVRQHFDEYNADEGVWKPWFTGLYTRRTPAD